MYFIFLELGNKHACVLLSLCDPMDCSPPGSPVHGILQARILEWAAISYSRGSPQLRDPVCISCIALQVGCLPLCHLGSPRKAEFIVKIIKYH